MNKPAGNGPAAPRSIVKTPFNDPKHIPTRAEIDLALGVLGALQLKEFEHRCDLLSPEITWSMYWHNPVEGWSYRATFRRKVLSILHFHHHAFVVTISIPLSREKQFLELRELSDRERSVFGEGTPSPGARWISLRIGKKDEIAPVIAILRKKMELLTGL